MKKLLPILLILGAANLFAQQQTDSLDNEQIRSNKNKIVAQKELIQGLQNKIEKQDSTMQVMLTELEKSRSYTEKEIGKLNSNYTGLNKEISLVKNSLNSTSTAIKSINSSLDNLNQFAQANNQKIDTNSEELGAEIQETSQEADKQIAQLDSSVENNRLYWIIATLATLLLGGLVYWLLGKRIKSSKTDVETQIKNTRASLEEESLKLDDKLVEVLETQLKNQQEKPRTQPVASNEKADHSLALKVADEIVRMQKNISKMEEGTKGLKPLLKGIERIKNNFAANGYEMINYLNKPYDDRMEIDVINFLTDENLPAGSQVITAVIKPQVNYKDVLVQKAQVDVTQN